MLKIKTFAQLQAARAEIYKFYRDNGEVEANGKATAWLTKEQKSRVDELRAAIDLASPNEPELKKAHLMTKAAAMPVRQKFGLKLAGKSIVIDSSDNSSLAIDEYVSQEISNRVNNSSTMLAAITIAPIESVDYYINRRINSAQTLRYEQSDGTLGYTRTDTVGGSFVKNKLNFSEWYHQLPATDEATVDVSYLVDNTLENLSDAYEDKFGYELVQGDSSAGELPGATTDLLDVDNAHSESLLDDDIRDVNTFGAIVSGENGGLGVQAHAKFMELTASLPTKLRSESTVYMNSATLVAYAGILDTAGNPIFKVTPDSFEGYPLELDDNMPTLNSDANATRAVVAFGNVDRSIKVGNINLSLKEDPYTRDGVTLFKNVGRVGLTVKDNTSLRFLLCQA